MMFIDVLLESAQWIGIIVALFAHYKLKAGIQNCWDFMTDYNVEKRITKVIDKASENYNQIYQHMASMHKDTKEELMEYDMVLKDHKQQIEGLLKCEHF